MEPILIIRPEIALDDFLPIFLSSSFVLMFLCLTPSIRTVPEAGLALTTFPFFPLSFPAMTITSSFEWIFIKLSVIGNSVIVLGFLGFYQTIEPLYY